MLSKAIGGYNQGHSRFNSTDSWSEMLIKLPRSLYQEASATEKQKSQIVAIKYVLDTLKNQDANKPAQNILPYRTYVYEGGKYPDDLKDEAGNPDPKAGTKWCFKYGEEEWLAPFDVKEPGLPTRKAKFKDYKKKAKRDKNLKVSCI